MTYITLALPMQHLAFQRLLFLLIASLFCMNVQAQQSVTNTSLYLYGPISYPVWLHISGPLTNSVELEVSHDLMNWDPLFSLTTSIAAVNVADREASADTNRMRFYRTKSPGISVDDEAATWAAVGPSHYRYHFRRTCFCAPAILSGTVIVQGGTVIGVTNALDEQLGQPIANPNLSVFKSIEDLFQLIGRARLQNADVIAVKYDSIFGFPARVDIDYSSAVDDEVTYEAGDVEPIN